MELVEDAQGSGRPKEDSEADENSIIQSVTKACVGREKYSEILAYEAGMFRFSVLEILKRYGFVIAVFLDTTY